MMVKLAEIVGDFGEDKDIAADLRNNILEPSIANQKHIELDFDGITLVTQSFIHALISSPLRRHGEGALDYIAFANCSDPIKGIIATVVQYSLDAENG